MERKIKKTAVLAVGNEVLCGDVINTNAAYIAREMEMMGAACVYQSVIPDDEDLIVSEMKRLCAMADLVITIGGLGPTRDDITKKAVAEALGRDLVYDEDTREAIEEYFRLRGIAVSGNNASQCWQPEGAQVMKNSCGTAPGSFIDCGGVIAAMFPGPPDELIPMFENEFRPMILPFLEKDYLERTFLVCGLPESSLEQTLRDSFTEEDGVTVNTYIDDGAVRLRLTVSDADRTSSLRKADRAEDALRKLFGKRFIEGGSAGFTEHVGMMLISSGLTLSTAESLTGGMLASSLVSVSGISSVYYGGGVTYTNGIKEKLVGVSRETLDSYGAVSAECAREMASGAARYFGTDIALSTTGVAGPSASEGKSVGTVFIAIYFRGETEVLANNYMGTREKIRKKTVTDALNLLRRYLERYCSEEKKDI